VEKQNQKQEQNQNPRTAENTEQVQERMEIDENHREKRKIQRLVIQMSAAFFAHGWKPCATSGAKAQYFLR